MNAPKMILFDYGRTLINESKYDGLKGTQAVLEYAVKNKYNLTAEDVQREANKVNDELGRYDRSKIHLFQVEAPNYMFTSYLYESLGIELSISGNELDRVFWNAATPGMPTEGIQEFLAFLKEQGIRTGVISNISYASDVVKERINTMIPDNDFEFIIATSQYLFRKPNKRIFDLALEKAELKPEDVWYIGDNYKCDVEGSRNAGMFPVWYVGATDKAEIETDALTVESWEALREYILKCDK